MNVNDSTVNSNLWIINKWSFHLQFKRNNVYTPDFIHHFSLLPEPKQFLTSLKSMKFSLMLHYWKEAEWKSKSCRKKSMRYICLSCFFIYNTPVLRSSCRRLNKVFINVYPNTSMIIYEELLLQHCHFYNETIVKVKLQ